MSLKGLKFVDVTRPTGTQTTKDPLQTAKQKAIQNWKQQQEILNAQKEGREYHTIDGKRPRRHFFSRGGKYYVTLRHGNQPIRISGKDTVEAGNTPEDAVNVFDQLIEATQNGDLDKPLMEAVEEQSKRLSGARKARR